LMPINDPTGQPDNIAVCIPWRKCSENVCGQASKEQGMTFAGEYPESRDEFMDSWESLNAARIQANDDFEAEEVAAKKAAVEKEKEKKKATPRKKRGALGTGEEADPEPVQKTGDGSSEPKRKGKSKAAVGKKLELSLDEALSRGDRLSTKTKDDEVNAIYKALEAGLGHAFPYKNRTLPGAIPSEKLWIAPVELKYRKIATARLGQVNY
jgi:hypothetical protein